MAWGVASKMPDRYYGLAIVLQASVSEVYGLKKARSSISRFGAVTNFTLFSYLEGIDVLYKTNTIHVTSPVLIRAMQDLISRQRLADITSLELLWETKLAPLSMGFTGFANSRDKLPAARPLFPGLRVLRISFKRQVNDDEDYTLGITLPCRHKILLDHGVHNFFLPEVDKLLERMVPHTTDVTITCPKWRWYEAIDLVLLEKQGKEETRMQRADIEGLKCWRNTPPRTNMPPSIWDVSDRALEDAAGVEGRRKGFWVHVGIEEVRLTEDGKFYLQLK